MPGRVLQRIDSLATSDRLERRSLNACQAKPLLPTGLATHGDPCRPSALMLNALVHTREHAGAGMVVPAVVRL